MDYPTIPIGCKHCEAPLDFEFTFAFQPIINISNRSIWGYEALVRGPNGESAASVLSQVNDRNRYAFDQACRVKAIRLASRLNLQQKLSINFLPNAVYEPEHCIQSTLKAAREYNFPISKILFEITESEHVVDRKHLTEIFSYYRSQGFMTALDDFGAGHAGLNMLASFIPDILKIDMELVQNIDRDRIKQVIVRNLVKTCQELNIQVLAEGLERMEEVAYFQHLGVELLQGYFFAKPGFESLPKVDFSALNHG
ncbi:EAL domain-containing protein [Thiomicrorhabdus sp. zzn3]|uniref:EAL domain-containing protein n=1 Tax=Thiomicrorhabdus sp. zzn3 TaxID=3039775 RepID=UPI002436957F|nr:EAL domain-containing protein [Thiomicrorhabdus sp. zzn3]MDG6777094.1 EAL domain-containing protein [Thiomicrorhabdus sp. zzn3]